MGKVEFDPDDPDLESKLRALEFRARMFGSNVVPLAYPSVVEAFVGTNHAYQWPAETTQEDK